MKCLTRSEKVNEVQQISLCMKYANHATAKCKYLCRLVAHDGCSVHFILIV